MTDDYRKRAVEMSKILSVAAALFLLAMLHVTGLVTVSNLSHPYWHVKATLVGDTIGVVVTIFLFWLIEHRPALVRVVIIVMAVAFPICLFITWYSAHIFIQSADFEALAGQVWHKGYQILVALFVPLVAIIPLRYANRF